MIKTITRIVVFLLIAMVFVFAMPKATIAKAEEENVTTEEDIHIPSEEEIRENTETWLSKFLNEQMVSLVVDALGVVFIVLAFIFKIRAVSKDAKATFEEVKKDSQATTTESLAQSRQVAQLTENANHALEEMRLLSVKVEENNKVLQEAQKVEFEKLKEMLLLQVNNTSELVSKGTAQKMNEMVNVGIRKSESTEAKE